MRKTLRELGIEQGWESGCLDRTAWKENIGLCDRVTTAPPPTMAKSDVRRRRRSEAGRVNGPRATTKHTGY